MKDETIPPWLKTNARKLILHVADHPGCSIWSIFAALWPYGNNCKAKLRALRRKIPTGVFSTGSGGWHLDERGKELAAMLRAVSASKPKSDLNR